eukprot:4857074-Alexandrium_andersonii.AAC.1
MGRGTSERPPPPRGGADVGSLRAPMPAAARPPQPTKVGEGGAVPMRQRPVPIPEHRGLWEPCANRAVQSSEGPLTRRAA